MATDLVEMDEPIYDVAVECEKLFEIQIARFNKAGDQNGAALIAELRHQFSTWTSSMRVFADASLNLDRKLQGHAEIQDQVLRGLDLMQANLAYVHMQDASPNEGWVEDSSPGYSLRLSIENVKAVSEALKRLHQIGMAVRQSSTMSHTRRAREYTESLDLSSFTQLASLCLRSLFATASRELLKHLTASMTDTYRLFIYRRKDIEPSTRQRYPRLSTIPESPTSEDMPAESMCPSGLGQSALWGVTRRRPAVAQSRPTTIDTREAASRLGRLTRPSTRRNTSSVLVSQVDYPEPAEDSDTCDWCFRPLPEDTFEGDNWRQHVNEDHRPFVCISDECMKSSFLPRFSTSSKWFQHMAETHGAEWHRRVYAPSRWICPLCHDNTIDYSSPEDLESHLGEEHESVGLTAAQKEMVIKQSRASCPRPRGDCPLCCFPIKDGQTYDQRSRNRNEHNKRSRSPQDFEPDGDSKRFRKQTSSWTSALPESENDPEGSPSASNPAPEVIAGHVAGHLRTIMLLTLKIISIEGPTEVSSDWQSISAQTDDHLSRVASSDKDLEEITNSSAPTSDHGGEVDEYNDLQDGQVIIPDLDEAITWDHVRHEKDIPIEAPVEKIYEMLASRRNKRGRVGRAVDLLQGKRSEVSADHPEMGLIRSQIKARGGRDQITLIDNFISMRPHREHLAKTARVISYFTKVADDDERKNIQPVQQLKWQSGGIMTMAFKDGQDSIKPTDIYVYTDGMWEDAHEVENVIKAAIRRLVDAKQDPSTLMIQFIQFGNDQNGSHYLQMFDEGYSETHGAMEYDIVDTKRWDDQIESIIIGSVTRENDNRSVASKAL
ncbi:hypothetical protein CEP53_011015 [Fusarium sp. AF-6]|nr:hypothetical protein CEP53_011015 [Fusarium sp. AF-6]